MNFNNRLRRQFLKKSALALGGMTTGIPIFRQNTPNLLNKISLQETALPKPTQGQIEWQEAEIGLIYHFDISVAVKRFNSGNNAYKEVFDPKQYNPEKLDTDQWIEAATAAGAKYAIFTATHFNGFLQWQSDAYPYGLKQAKWKDGKGDIVGNFVNSCHKAGIKPGIYLSTHRNAYWELWDHYVDWGKGKGTPKQEEFNRAAEKMVEELCTKYGPLIQIWFDAGTKMPYEGGPDSIPIFEKYQPTSVYYHSTQRSDHRWIGNESGYADYPCWATMPETKLLSHNAPSWKPILGSGDPDGTIWSPGMVDIPLRGTHDIHSWFWAPDQDQGAYSKDELVKIYYDSVGRNCNLAIGEVITPEGLVPESDIKVLKEFGKEIKKRFSKPVAQIQGNGNELNLPLKKSSKINHVVLMEDIAHGERIREFEIEGKTPDGWKTLTSGSAVGHKFIGRFDDVEVSEVQLKVLKSTDTPIIKEFSTYHAG